ncbi:hypothetical protein G6F68_011051 [Rhizopus microsporus]|nr:hypothetical protein G6F68_011051 [Rhizopus microsporus]
MAQDLESFAKHGRRSVISMEDVKLCARRNDTLYETISELAKDITEETSIIILIKSPAYLPRFTPFKLFNKTPFSKAQIFKLPS